MFLNGLTDLRKTSSTFHQVKTFGVSYIDRVIESFTKELSTVAADAKEERVAVQQQY